MVRTILIFALLAHAAITIFSLKETGFGGPFPPFNELYVYQIFSDLVVALTLVLFFIYIELKRKNRSLKPLFLCGLGMLCLGSFSPLIYLLIDKDLFN